MTIQYINFLVSATNSAPRSLPESIRQVGNLSAGFCHSWLSNDIPDALTTSEEAFQLFDHIQNEILRHRDEQSKQSAWTSSVFKAALDATVGELLEPATSSEIAFFKSCPLGDARLTLGATTVPLTLAVALNKLKHRSTSTLNFTISSSGAHVLYIFTNAGMNKPDTISRFSVNIFCGACKIAAAAI